MDAERIRVGNGSNVPRIVIIGAGFGGLAAARKLQNISAEITIIDRSNHHLFQPLLYQVATSSLTGADISMPVRAIFKHYPDIKILMATVSGINKEQHQVIMTDCDPVSFDYLIIATGSSENYFRHQEWKTYAPGMKTLVDAEKIREKILSALEVAERESNEENTHTLLSFALVGAGPTGVELAGAIAELTRQVIPGEFRHIHLGDTHIYLIERDPRILNAFPEDLAAVARRKLERMGVEVLVNSKVDHIEQDAIVAGGRKIQAKTIIWTAGVQATPVASWLGAEIGKGDRVLVNKDFSMPGSPNIYVIGDAALGSDKTSALPALAPVAIQEGRYVAQLIKNRIKKIPFTKEFEYHDKGDLATIGRGYAIGEIKGLHFKGIPAWLIWAGVHITYLIGFRNRAAVLLQWAWSYLANQRSARYVSNTSEESASLLSEGPRSAMEEEILK